MEPASEAGIEVLVANTFNPESPGTRVSGLAPGEGIRCLALRRRFKAEIPCAPGHKREAAAVICIGSPAAGDLERGQRCLRENGIAPLHAGAAAAGLVFIVFADAAEEALRALHSGLLPAAAEAVA
jgi:aspartokinase